MAAPRHDWYLKDWLKALGKRQADIANDLDWNKAKVSLTATGKQPYTRDDLNEVADYLNVRPYELLMHPEDAFRMRRLLADMIRLAHENEPPPDEPPSPDDIAAIRVDRELSGRRESRRKTGTHN